MIIEEIKERSTSHLLLMIAVATAEIPKARPIEPIMTGVLGIFSRFWIQLIVAKVFAQSDESEQGYYDL